jgi:hypothetical protein
MPDRSALTNARAALQRQRSALVDALYQDYVASQAVLAAQRQSAAALAAAQAQEAATAQALAQVRDAVARAQGALTATIGTWLAPNDFRADIGQLEAASPIVLFPVRIETRFDTAALTLKVRVYPDEIFLNSHETALTPAELAAGQHYYNDLNTVGESTEHDNWAQMVRQFGAPRSAYILRIVLPIFLGEVTMSSSSCSIPTGQGEQLVFPSDIQLRPSTWTRATEAVLPDRWVVMTRRGNTRTFFAGNPVPEPLAMTVNPGASAAQQSALPNGMMVDDASRWTVDFDRAVQVGMGVTIPLSAQDAALGFDRVVVFGVKTSLSALDTSAALEQLLDAHHYTRGLAFVHQGFATNNTKNHPTEFPPSDDAALNSFAIERTPPPCDRFHAHPILPNTTDGYFWTKLLGVPSGVVQNVDRALHQEHAVASSMTTAMWPVTYGSFLQFLMDPVFTAQQIANAKAYFIANVFPRGPAPAFRVGAVPYGVLPTTSLARWQARGLGSTNDEAVEAGLLAPLRLAVPIWKNASAGVAQIRANSANPQLDLARVLSLYPSAREVRLRIGLGPQLTFNLFDLLAWDIAEALAKFDVLTNDLFARVGHPEWRPRIGRTVFLRPQFLETTPLVDLPQNLSETATIASNYFAGIANASVGALLANNVSGKPAADNLLYELLRTSTLTEYARVADAFLRTQVGVPFFWVNYEVWDLNGLPPASTSIMSLMQQTSPFPPASQFPTLGDYARLLSSAHEDAVLALFEASTAELDRLFTETLDVASHRIDAWVTAFATRRIFALRTTQEQANLSPLGTFLGGYGWVENLRPEPRGAGTAPDGTPVEIDPTSGGFIHSPSSSHAMTAAILRNGYLSMSREDPQKGAFDLSSRRVRKAMRALEEVRAGLTFGEVLGYRFERGLQEDHPNVPGLNALRFTFRSLYPLVAGKNGVDTSAPPGGAAARTVVDGLALYRAFKAGQINFSGNLPAPGTSAYAAVVSELNNLDQLIDGISDLLTAEGVYQLVSGNTGGAPASLDNLIRGGVPPAPVVAQSPRTGPGLTHKVAYVFQGPPPALPPNWPTNPTGSARATAEPVLNAWIGSIVGDAANVTATVTFQLAGVPVGPKTVTLAQLAIQPLDLLALSNAVAQPNQGSLLEAQIVLAALQDDATASNPVVSYAPAAGRDPATNRTFAEVVEVMRTLQATLAGARPLAVADLLTPADQTSVLPAVETTALANAQEILGRAGAALKSLTSARDAVQTAVANATADPTTLPGLRAAVRAAAQFAPERALVPSAIPLDALTDTANALLTELDNRQSSATSTIGGLPSPATSAQTLQAAADALGAIFGSDFFAMPEVAPPNESELQQALGIQSTLLGPDPQRVVARFLIQSAHGRPQLAATRKLALYLSALGVPTPSAQVVQLPVVPGESWFALKLATPPTESRLSIVLVSQGAALDPSLNWTGILVDGWTESIPSTVAPTSVAFNYNSPRPNAPQCVLVVAPSSAGASWVADDLVATLEETLDLAKVRAVDRELLDIGQVLPAVVIPNSSNVNVTTSSGNIGVTVQPGPFFQAGFS